jgi:hypothetical protein
MVHLLALPFLGDVFVLQREILDGLAVIIDGLGKIDVHNHFGLEGLMRGTPHDTLLSATGIIRGAAARRTFRGIMDEL